MGLVSIVDKRLQQKHYDRSSPEVIVAPQLVLGHLLPLHTREIVVSSPEERCNALKGQIKQGDMHMHWLSPAVPVASNRVGLSLV